MPQFGGLSPAPERYGGGNRRLQRLAESIGRQRGTAYDSTTTSNVYAENLAIAKTLNAAWATNTRLSFLWDPLRMDLGTLARWERMLGIVVAATDSTTVRRARLQTLFLRLGQIVTEQSITNQIQAALGPVFVAVEFISPANAVTWWPGGATNPAAPWYSTIAHVLIRVTKPVSYTEADFQAAVGLLLPLLDPQLPAWTTWDWYRPGPTPINVSGGPSAGGFFLDQRNLNNEVFAV